MAEGVILAAGRGSRLGNVTVKVPKPLLTFMDGDKLLDVQIRYYLEANVEPIYVVAQYKIEEIQSWIHQKGYPSCVVVKQKAKLGTAADGILAVAKYVHDDFLVIHADHFISYNPFHELLDSHHSGQITFLVEDPGSEFNSLGYGRQPGAAGRGRCSLDRETRDVNFTKSEPQNCSNDVIWVDGCYLLPRSIFLLIATARQANPDHIDMDQIFGHICKEALAVMKGVSIQGWWANVNDTATFREVSDRLFPRE